MIYMYDRYYGIKLWHMFYSIKILCYTYYSNKLIMHMYYSIAIYIGAIAHDIRYYVHRTTTKVPAMAIAH